MKKWIAKAVVQKAISFLPYRTHINHFFQKYVTKGAILTDDYFQLKLMHAKEHIEFFQQYKSTDTSKKTALELGTGWYPIVPIYLYLAGFEQVITIDSQDWKNAEKFLLTLDKFITHQADIPLSNQHAQGLAQRWEKIKTIQQNGGAMSIEELGAAFHIQFVVGDARKTDWADGSMDFICSNNTFEHIPPEILKDILLEFKRLLAPRGIMSHFIDMSDHFAHFDTSINIYNFLRFEEKQWQRIDNSIQPQNRLRMSDYHAIYDELGIPYQEEKVRPGDIEALASIPLSSQFQSYAPAALAISHGYLITTNS